MLVDEHLAFDQVLELDILEQYTQAIGGQALLGSVDLFAQQYPQYLSILRGHFDNEQYELAAEEGHKMKGAAGAIGLARLGQWAEIIQNRDNDQWMINTPKIIQLLESLYESDIENLRQYLSCR
jgi:two-component system aerobic respiration control sensor histidine kinase ArcB